MENDYVNFTCKELLRDGFFLESVSNPTSDSELFWREIASKDSRLAKEIALAKEIIVLASYCQSHIASDAEEMLFERIGATIANQQNASRQSSFSITLLSVSACLLLLVSAGYFVFDYLSKNNRTITALSQPVEMISDNISEIKLIKPDGEVTLEGDTPAIRYDTLGKVSVNSESFPDRFVSNTLEPKSHSPQHQLVVPFAKRSFLTLSDGSKIWVNANTSLTYPAVFDDDRREVYVAGEIYLEVEPDEKRPFIVRTKEMDINVLGTSFNVTAYGNNSETSVVLVSGKVNVTTKDNQITGVLSPGEIAYLTHDRIEIGRVDIENYISWRLGKYKFNQESFSAVLKKLSNYYGRELKLDQGSQDFYCSGTLNLKDDLEKMLQSLEKAYSITFYEDEERIIVSIQTKKQYMPMGE